MGCRQRLPAPNRPAADSNYNDVTVIKPKLVVEIASKSTETIGMGNKMVVYANGGIPSYRRVTRDGVIHPHQLMADGQYGLVATVKPGDAVYKAVAPFPVALDARKLVS